MKKLARCDYASFLVVITFVIELLMKLQCQVIFPAKREWCRLFGPIAADLDSRKNFDAGTLVLLLVKSRLTRFSQTSSIADLTTLFYSSERKNNSAGHTKLCYTQTRIAGELFKMVECH